jgi:uncharacterized damage-inducible protein DinB
VPNTGLEYARSFASHSAPLIELLEKLPADQSDFASWDGGMSFKRLTDHLSGSMERFGAMLVGQTPAKPEPSPDWPAALERLRTSTDGTRARFSEMTPEQIAATVTGFGGREMPVHALMDGVIQHTAHHKGQIWMMARMVGVEPPMFLKMG